MGWQHDPELAEQYAEAMAAYEADLKAGKRAKTTQENHLFYARNYLYDFLGSEDGAPIEKAAELTRTYLFELALRASLCHGWPKNFRVAVTVLRELYQSLLDHGLVTEPLYQELVTAVDDAVEFDEMY